ncbi:MAG: molybdenum cofactor guanylyltransferase [Ardenticatenaceae bacterium]|nr:molybdenum cofactor guanylyltransferase [Anaerolineales bacterium]MCB8922862.1 molybdenum cofactor guanylyltransferase [Ardenticatenaceae bacterium]MCB9005441.1 molybdenum cofactor guanylyltransferase [Ardenticatenaceae bacterium]
MGVTVAIMAGGQSSRMGRDKSFVLFEGQPLIERVRDRVADLGNELILITNKPAEYAHLGLPIYGDVIPDCGPLGGIYTAVHHASYPHTLVVACDMPWLNRGLLQYMISLRETADIVVPRWEKFPEPLHAVYGKACLPAMYEKLQAQQLKITGFFGRMSVRFVDREEIERWDEDGRSFTNINTPHDLQAMSD